MGRRICPIGGPIVPIPPIDQHITPQAGVRRLVEIQPPGEILLSVEFLWALVS